MAEQIKVGELVVDIAADVTDLKLGLDKVNAALKNSNKKVKTFQEIWKGALRQIGVGLVNFAAKTVKRGISKIGDVLRGIGRTVKDSVLDAARFQTALSEVASLGVKQMGALREGVMDVAVSIGEDLPTATRAAYQAISAGIPEENVIDFLRVGAEAATAGVTDMATAVDALSTAVNAYGAGADEARLFSDQFFEVIKLGKTTFPELAQSIGTVLPTAAALGIEFSEVGGALAVMTQKGINTTEAVTALNALLLQLLSPAEQSATQIQKIVDAAGGLEDINLAVAVAEFDKLNTAVKAELLGNVRSVKAILAIGGEGPDLTQDNILQQIARDAVEASVKMRDLRRKEEDLAVTKGLKTFQTALQSLAPAAEELNIPLGEVSAAMATMVERGTPINTAMQTLGAMFRQIENPAGNVEQAINEIVKDAGGLENISLADFVEEFGKLDDVIKTDILGGMREVQAASFLTDREGEGALEDKIRDIDRASKLAASRAKRSFSGLAAAIDQVEGSAGATKKAFAEFGGDMEHEVDKAAQAITNFKIDLATPIEVAVGGIAALFNEKLAPHLPAVSSAVAEWLTAVWKGTPKDPGLQQAIEDAATQMDVRISADLQEVMQGNITLTEAFEGWFNAVGDNVPKWIDTLWESKIMVELRNTLKEQTPALKAFGRAAGIVLAQGIIIGVATVPNAIMAWLAEGIRFGHSESVRDMYPDIPTLPWPPVLPVRPTQEIDPSIQGAGIAEQSGGAGMTVQGDLHVSVQPAPGATPEETRRLIEQVVQESAIFGATRGGTLAEAH